MYYCYVSDSKSFTYYPNSEYCPDSSVDLFVFKSHMQNSLVMDP